MLQKFKSVYRQIKYGIPGRRFVDHHERTARTESPRGKFWRTLGFVGAGAVLLICGLLLSVPPGVPGFLLWIPGLALIASRFERLAALLDRLEVFARQAWRRLHRAWQQRRRRRAS